MTDIHAAQGRFKQIGPGKYQKYNHALGILTTVVMEPCGIAGKVTLRVKHEQRVDDIIELNKQQQNNFQGFRKDLMTQTSRVPTVHWQEFMKRCGQDKTTGEYDRKALTKILNDSDYKYFKTVDKRL